MWIFTQEPFKKDVSSVGPSSAKSRSQLSLLKTESSDYVIICVRVLPSRVSVSVFIIG